MNALMRGLSGGVLVMLSPLATAVSSIYTVTSTSAATGACTANSTTDSDCTLQGAVNVANGGDIIEFASAIQGQTITLAGELNLTKSLRIDASPDGITISGGNAIPIFLLNSGASNTVLSHLTLTQGLGSNSGAGIYNLATGVLVDSCTLTANAGTFGGGIFQSGGGSMQIINSTIAGNSASAGGGIFVQVGGSVVVANSTVAENTASGSGAGIGVANSGSLTLFSSIVAQNFGVPANEGVDIYNPSATTSLGNNLIGDAEAADLTATTGDQFGTTASPINPQFISGTPSNYGGATPTLALLSTSPAAGAGNCSGNPASPVIAAVTVDQRGEPRSTPCTVGAFDLNGIFANSFGN